MPGAEQEAEEEFEQPQQPQLQQPQQQRLFGVSLLLIIVLI